MAAHECTISEKGNPGVAPRNQRNRLLFGAAHRVQQGGLDPDVIWGWLHPDAPTVPELPAVEDDGGDARRDATSEAVVGMARDGVDERAGG